MLADVVANAIAASAVLLALALGLYNVWRQAEADRRPAVIEQREEERQKTANLVVEMITGDAGGQMLIVKNEGPVTASDVDVPKLTEFDSDTAVPLTPLQGSGVLPFPSLRPGQSFRLGPLLVPSCRVFVTWTDERGPQSKDFYLA